MSMEDAIITAASAGVVAVLVLAAFVMGFRARVRLDADSLARELSLAEPGATLEAAIFAPDGRAALAKLTSGKLLVARVMGDGVALRAAPVTSARVALRRGKVHIAFADVGFPPLHIRISEPAPDWLSTLAGGRP